LFNKSSHHKGSYLPKNKHKYIGDISDINFRSRWEYLVMRYLDMNPDVKYWSSEETVIKYKCSSDGELHNYSIDFTIKYTNGKVLLVEVKPKNQTILPKPTKGKSKKTYLSEALAFQKNKSKWLSAHEYAQRNNARFVIWTEDYLKNVLKLPIF
jgi:hypothetical protein